MKKLLMAIFIPILVILGTPAFALTLMYDGTGDEHMPVHLYTDDHEDAKTMLFSELDSAIQAVEDETNSDLEFTLHQDILNRAIYEAILEQNPDYQPGDDCVTDEECYIFAQPVEADEYNLSFRVVGMWVSFYGGETAADLGRFVYNIYLEVNLDGGTSYKTIIELHFLFDDDEDYYYLEFDKVQMGRLPVPKSFFTTVINIVESQADIDLEEEVGGIPIGELDLNNLSYTLEKDEILANMVEGDDGEVEADALLAQQLLSIVFDNQLVVFDLEDEQFVLTAGVSKFSSDDIDDIPAYLYDLHDKTVVDGVEVIGEYNPELFDPEAYLQNVFTEFIFNNALLGGGFEITEKTFNKLIYSNMDGFADTRQMVEIQVSDTETKEIELGLKAIWFEFESDGIYAKALFQIAGIESLLVLRADETSTSDTELVFEFVEITVGKDSGENPGDFLDIQDMAAFQGVFAELGDVEFGTFTEDGDLVISAEQLSSLLQEGSAAGAVVVTAINMEQDAIVLTVEAADATLQTTLENFQNALETTLGDAQLLTDLGGVLDTTDGGTEQAVYESMQDIQETLSGGTEEVTPEQIETLFENFEDLDTETQEDFLTTIAGSLDETTLQSFEDMFGTFSGDDSTTTE